MSYTLPTQTIHQANHRELIFEGYADGEESVSLMVEDLSTDATRDGFYKIPLYSVTTQNAQNNQADIELVHVYPIWDRGEMFANSATAHLRDGFIYIFVDGHLWRELRVCENKDNANSMFMDVNLAFQKGNLDWRIVAKGSTEGDELIGERLVTGKAVPTILVPHKMQGRVCNVQMAFSETQWSWQQIESFGGMNAADPRLNYGPRVKPGINDQEAQTRRGERMQTLSELGQYQSGYNNSLNNRHIALPVSNIDNIYMPVLADPIGQARQICAEIILVKKSMQLAANKSNEKALKRSAQEPQQQQNTAALNAIAKAIQSTFIAFPNQIEAKQELGETVTEEEEDTATRFRDMFKDEIDQSKFRQYINTDDVFKLAEYLNNLKSIGFTVITDENSNGSFYQCMRDFAYCKDIRREQLYSVLSDVIGPYRDLTHELVAGFAIEASDFSTLKTLNQEDLGQELILKLLASHPEDIRNARNQLQLTELLYPKNQSHRLKDYKQYEDPIQGFDYRFDVEAVKNTYRSLDELGAEQAQVARRLSQLVWGLLMHLTDVPTAMFATEGTGVASSTRQTDYATKQANLQQQQHTLNQEIEDLRAEINQKNKYIAETRRAKNDIIASLLISGADSKSIEAQLTQRLNQEQQMLASLEQNLAKAELQVKVSKQNLKSLQAVGEKWVAIEGSTKIRHISIDHNPYYRYMHLADVVTDDLLKEIDINIQDYFDGDLPDGVRPLNFQNKALRAEQRLNEFARASEGFDAAYHGDSKPPVVKAKVNDTHTVQSRLDHIINLDGSLDTMQDLINKQQQSIATARASIKQTMVVLDGSKIEELKGGIDGTKELIDDLQSQIMEANWQLDSVTKESDALKKVARWQLEPGHFNRVLNGVLPLVAVLEVYNFWSTVKDNKKAVLDKVSALADLIDITLNIAKNIAELRYGLPTPKQSWQVIRQKGVPTSVTKANIFGVSQLSVKVALVVMADLATFVAGALSTWIALRDMNNAFAAGNTELAHANLVMAMGFAGLTLSSLCSLAAMPVAAASGAAAVAISGILAIAIATLAILGLILVLIGAVALMVFAEGPLQGWLQACPWGRRKYISDPQNQSSARAAQWQEAPALALLDFYNALYAPSLKMHSVNIIGQLTIELVAPFTANQEGVDFKLLWRNKGDPNMPFTPISHHQLADLQVTWAILPNRTGWRVRIYWQQLKHLLQLTNQDSIELQAQLKTYPLGKAAEVIPGSGVAFCLPFTLLSSETDKNQIITHTYGQSYLTSISFKPQQTLRSL
ncbi:hypothetical protein [Pseudoalteromonas phenolica]|uniref:hypothetical protein n=1 Tax=Pseudoalteromonas phenolica TaxID=161398 RepID=UPI00384B6AB9